MTPTAISSPPAPAKATSAGPATSRPSPAPKPPTPTALSFELHSAHLALLRTWIAMSSEMGITVTAEYGPDAVTIHATGWHIEVQP